MAVQQLDGLIRIRQFPAVVHPRHAHELLERPEANALEAWLGGYVIASPEHRRLLEDVLGSLAWKSHGQALLIHGLYGTGKSHLQLVLHLLAALPPAWAPFLNTHPTYQRYTLPMQARRLLTVHFSLDAYAPGIMLESALHQELLRALHHAGVTIPDDWNQSISRADAWHALLAGCREQGFDGLLLLLDELSLFLASKAPELREADAAFLQFLAEMTSRYPLWLIGALQRRLSDSGALPTHSWRQVEDRFRRYALPVQEIGHVVYQRLVERLQPAEIRTLVNELHHESMALLHLPLNCGEMQLHWPFHPEAIDLLCEVANNYLSPHRSLVSILQQLPNTDLFSREATRLITPLDLYALIEDDLLADERLLPLWQAYRLLQRCQELTGNAELANVLLRLLMLAYLADRTLNVAQMQLLLFDGITTPEVADISRILHQLRRRGAYLQVLRHHDPAAETFTLTLDDAVGVDACALAEEWQRDFAPCDARVLESVLHACSDETWPFAAAEHGLQLPVEWLGSSRRVTVQYFPELRTESLSNAYEAVRGGHTDGFMLLLLPTGNSPDMPILTAAFDQDCADAVLCWRPQTTEEHHWRLWCEYAAWRRAADEDAATRRARQVRQRCLDRAEELREVVAESIRELYLAGEWFSLSSNSGAVRGQSSLAGTLGNIFAAPFSHRYPRYVAIAQHGVPSRIACQQLLLQFIAPGAVTSVPSLLAEYIERILVPFDCARMHGDSATVTPPAHDLLTPILAQANIAPLRFTDALRLLEQSPLGLTADVGGLVIACALRTGVLHGLDSFLQPMPPDVDPYEFPAFINTPAPLDDTQRRQAELLSTRLSITDMDEPLRCVYLERALRDWQNRIRQQMPQLRAAFIDWSEILQLMPWAWRDTVQALDSLHAFGDTTPTLPSMLQALGDEPVIVLDRWEEIEHAAIWWLQHRDAVATLCHATMPTTLREEAEYCRQALGAGEASVTSLPDLGARLRTLFEQFDADYRVWHESLFGAEQVNRLRSVFEQAEFRAVKLLARLPLPPPDAAARCLAALEQARSAYCPGALQEIARSGYCMRCRLPYGAPSPMPDAKALMPLATHALLEYVDLLATHPWALQAKSRIPRAPDGIARDAHALFCWKITDGAGTLLPLLNDALLGWLCRTDNSAGRRNSTTLLACLQGHDLTLAEARSQFEDWLDPEKTLTNDTILSFE